MSRVRHERSIANLLTAIRAQTGGACQHRDRDRAKRGQNLATEYRPTRNRILLRFPLRIESVLLKRSGAVLCAHLKATPLVLANRAKLTLRLNALRRSARSVLRKA